MLLQVEIEPNLNKRIDGVVKTLGMTKRTFVTRLIEAALPQWEKVTKPGPVTKPTK